MLERQHAQLVSCVQELYQRARKAGSWDPLLPEDLERYPSVHDILATLDLLEPKDDGSRDFETFHEVVGPTQSDNDTPASVLDRVTEGQDHHDSTPNQSKSPLLPCEDTRSSSPGNFIRKPDSMVSSRPPSSSDRSVEPSPEHSKQTTAQTLTSHMSCSRTLAGCNSSQARLFATLSAAPLNRTFHNTSNVPVQYGTTTTKPSLTLDPRVIRQSYTSYKPSAASPDQLPFCHEWARSGITLDDSDFSTDFRWLSQLNAGKANVGHADLVSGIM
jgi:hypothetical protein